MYRILYLFSLLIIATATTPSNGQTVKMDFVFNWKISKDNMWIPLDTSLQKFTPTANEIQLAKELSIKHIDSLQSINEEGKEKILSYIHEEYFRQYLGYIDNEGNRIIFINACCAENGGDINLEKHWIFAMDGGSCYFQIMVDVNKKKCFNLNVNGG